MIKTIIASFKQTKIPYADLMQEGRIGVIEALKSYDLSKNTQFTTHVYWIIKKNISRCIRETEDLIKEPGWIHDQRHKVMKEAAKLEMQNSLTIETLSKRCGTNISATKTILNWKPADHINFDIFGADSYDGRNKSLRVPQALIVGQPDVESIDPKELYEAVAIMIEAGATAETLAKHFKLKLTVAKRLYNGIVRLEKAALPV